MDLTGENLGTCICHESGVFMSKSSTCCGFNLECFPRAYVVKAFHVVVFSGENCDKIIRILVSPVDSSLSEFII